MSTSRRQIAESQQWCGLKDAILHLQLPIVYLIWGLLRHCWMLRRWLEAVADCWWGQQHDAKCSFYFKCYFFRTTPTNRDLREKAVYYLGPQAPPQWITFLPFVSQNILLNINDVELDFSMACILVLFPFLWIINVQFKNFGFLNFQFFYFQI